MIEVDSGDRIILDGLHGLQKNLLVFRFLLEFLLIFTVTGGGGRGGGGEFLGFHSAVEQQKEHQHDSKEPSKHSHGEVCSSTGSQVCSIT